MKNNKVGNNYGNTINKDQGGNRKQATNKYRGKSRKKN